MKDENFVTKFESKDWIFNLENINKGRLFQKYNIISACIDNYLVKLNQLKNFEIARSKQDLNAFEKYGRRIILMK